MKKNRTIIVVISAAILVFSIILSSCSNFLSGSELLKQLEDEITYANAPSFSVRIAADNGTGTIVTGAGDKNVKVGDSFNLEFNVNDGYKFLYWMAIDKDTGKDLSEYVEFNPKDKEVTVVKILKEGNILIKPVSVVYLAVNSFFPDTSTSSSTSVPKDSDIEIAFNKPLSASNNLDEITVFMDGYSVDEYFSERIINDKYITLKADKEKFIPVLSETKTIVVTIPSTFYYEEGSELEKITLDTQIVKSYRVNNTTSNKATVNISNKDSEGDISITGDKILYISDELSVSFVPKEEYEFENWLIQFENGSPVADTILEQTLSENKDTLTIKLLRGYESQKIIVKPVCHLKSSLAINFSTDHGSTIPAETKYLYLGDELSLSYREEAGYAFTGWKIIDNLTGKEASDVLEFKGNGTDVTVKVLKVNCSVTVKVETVARPKIVSATPLYDTSGVYRDRPIVIMFNKEMSEKSIYWTKKELLDMKVDLKNAFEATDMTYIDENGKQQPYYYAYWDGKDKNSYVYKNISISKYTNDSINYLQYYGIPQFDDFNARVLRIPTKVEIEKDPTDETKTRTINLAPPGATDILITIAKNFFLESENKEITLSEDYSWVYSTNMETDVDPPEFDTNTFEVHFADKEQTLYDDRKVKMDDTLLNNIESDPTTIQNYNAKSKTFWVKGKLIDTGSGIANLQWYITKVASTYYEEAFNTLYAQGKIFDLTFATPNATIGTGTNSNEENGGVLIDVSENLEKGFDDLAEGTYALYFEVVDKNGQKAKSEPYYFVYDVTPPSASTVNYLSARAKDIVKIQKNVNTTIDYYKTEINKVAFDNNTTTKEFDNLEITSNKHKFTVIDYDYAGNYRETTITITAKPEVGMIYYTDGYFSTYYDSERTPEGVVCKVDSGNKFYIWDIWDQYGYCWGNTGLKIQTNYAPGIDIYDILLKKFGEELMRAKGMSRIQDWSDKGQSPGIWTYVLDKNKEKKPEDAGVKSEKWFIPSLNEMDYVFESIEKMEPTFNTIKTRFGHTERETIYTDYAYRQVDLISRNGIYWTSDIHNTYQYNGCPVVFYTSNMIQYFRNDGSFYGFTEEKKFHTYKNEILYMGKAYVNNGSDGRNYCMDRCIRYSEDVPVSIDTGWSSWDMNTHAMALIEFE